MNKRMQPERTVFSGLCIALAACTGMSLASTSALGSSDAAQTDMQQSALTQADPLACVPATSPLPAMLNLGDIIQRTLCNNPETRQAWLAIKQQKAQLALSKSSYWPQLNASYDYLRGRSDYQVSDYPQLSYNSSLTSHGLSIEANWILFDFGMRAADVRQQKFLLAAAYANQHAAIQRLLASTVQAYYTLNRLQANLNANTDIERLAQTLYQAAEARHKAGAGSLADVLQAKTSLSKASLNRIKSTGELQIAKGELAAFMGAPVNNDYAIAADSSQIASKRFQLSLDELLAQATRSHPQLQAAQAQVDAAAASLARSKQQGWPTLSLNSNAVRNQQQGTPPADTRTSSLNWGLRLSMPLFEGFAQQHRIQLAQAELEASQNSAEQTRQQVLLEVWKNYYLLQSLHDSISANDTLLQSAQQSYEIETGRYKAGVGSMLDVLNAQNALADARQQQNAAYADWQSARAQLLGSLGVLGIWSVQ